MRLIALSLSALLVSAWRGDIFFVSDEGEVVKILDTRDEGVLQNDLSVFGDLASPICGRELSPHGGLRIRIKPGRDAYRRHSPQRFFHPQCGVRAFR